VDRWESGTLGVIVTPLSLRRSSRLRTTKAERSRLSRSHTRSLNLSDADQPQQRRRNGRLSIPLPFEEALRKAVKAEPPEKVKKSAPGRKRAAKR
jgi:hypothetical protein